MTEHPEYRAQRHAEGRAPSPHEEHEEDALVDTATLLEMLEQLEVQLLDYEQQFQSGSDDTSPVHRIFRVAHNLKSSLSMAAKTYSSAVIHAVETNFDLIRKGRALPVSRLFLQALIAIDRIRMSLEAQEEDAAALQAVQCELESVAKQLQSSQKATFTLDVVLQLEQEQLVRQAIRTNQRIFRVEKLINPRRISRELYESLPVLDDVREIGTLIAVYPSYEALPEASEEAVVKILFSTYLSPEDVAMHIFDPCTMLTIGEASTKSPPLTAQPTAQQAAAQPIITQQEPPPAVASLDAGAGAGTSALIEALEDLELHIMEYERIMVNNPDDTAFVHYILRYAHNLRGTLAMAHRQDLSQLVYAIESNFEFIYHGLVRSTALLVHRCLQAINLIRKQIVVPPETLKDAVAEQRQLTELFQELKRSALKAEFTPTKSLPRGAEPRVEHVEFPTQDTVLHTPEDADAGQSEEEQQKRSLKTLVVEDDFVSQLVLYEILAAFGAVDVASDGKEAVELFQQALQRSEGYDAVFLDIMMPVMDGVQALQELRGLERVHNIRGARASKIVMTTVINDIQQIFRAFRLQCDAYIVKPIAKPKVLYQLKKLHLITAQQQQQVFRELVRRKS